VKIALSTNWCNRRFGSGEEIADKALELGFDELELGYGTDASQVPGFRRRLDVMPVGSVHAFCPVPVSAPEGYPELYALASFDADQRALAAVHVRRNVEFAAGIGAGCVVLHAGRVSFSPFFSKLDSSVLKASLEDCGGDVRHRRYMKKLSLARCVRRRRGLKMLDIFCRELEALLPVLERNRVVLGLENMPYLEGFPDETETSAVLARFGDAPVKAWFDTGHDRVRQLCGWAMPFAARSGFAAADFAGMHLNDVAGTCDDHFCPSFGTVDFASLRELARSVRHVVFEPSSRESEERLARSLEYIRGIWA
jgi:sugar phosphate isomerase/epimerase